MPEGWIKLHRKLLDWEWFQDGEMVHLFIYFLLKANYEDKKWKGVDVKRGQLVTGLYKIKIDTGLSIQKIRTCIRRMETEKNPKINKQSNNQYTIITVCNYDSYQGNGVDVTNEITNEQQTNNKPITTTKEYKEEKEEEKKGVILPFKTEEFKEAWNEWKKFKAKEFNFNYKSEISERKALSKLSNLSEHNEEFAIKIIDKSMENGWKGFFELKEGEKPKPPKIFQKR